MKNFGGIALALSGLIFLVGDHLLFAQSDATGAAGKGKDPPHRPEPGPKPWPSPPPGPTWGVGQSASSKQLEDYRTDLEAFRARLENAREANGGRATAEYQALFNEYRSGMEKYDAEKQKLHFNFDSTIERKSKDKDDRS